MPSSRQEIYEEISKTNNDDTPREVKKGDENGEKHLSIKQVTSKELNDDQKLAYALRDFLGSPKVTVIDSEIHEAPQPPLNASLPYIDEQPGTDDAQSDDERQVSRDTDTVLNNAACRLRRWRAVSRKLRRPRVNKNLSGNEESRRNTPADNNGHAELADRLRSLASAGGVSASASELLSLAPPPPAATAPPSPGCLLTPSLADQSTSEYFVSIVYENILNYLFDRCY